MGSHFPCENQKQIIEFKNFDHDGYVERIDILFKLQQLGLCDEELYDFVREQYPNGNIIHFINDYHQFMKNLDKNQTYLKHKALMCCKQECMFMRRSNRYNGRRSTRECKHHLSINRMLDQLHILIHQHLDKTECKNNRNEMKNEKNTDSEVTEPEFVLVTESECIQIENEMKKSESDGYITMVSELLKVLQQDGNHEMCDLVCDLVQSQHPNGGNRFVTTLLNDGDDSKYLKYSYGHYFNYKKLHVEEWECEQWDDLYDCPDVMATYKSMKEEIVDGGWLTMEQYNNEKKKAKKMMDSDEGKKLKASESYEGYDESIQEGMPIALKNMLSLLFYTNYDNLQNNFSQTFRKLWKNEQFEHVRKRHSVLANFAKNLRNTVKCFGENMRDDDTFYHGINQMAIFESMTIKSFCPMSMTTCEEVAKNFATNVGSVLTIKKKTGVNARCFDCMLWGDYASEGEKFFVGVNGALIANILDVHNHVQYEDWILILRMFEAIWHRDNHAASRPTIDMIYEYKHKLNALMDSVIWESTSDVPDYIIANFNRIRTKSFDRGSGVWRDIYMDMSIFDGVPSKDLMNINFDNNEKIKWSLCALTTLFPSVDVIKFVNTEFNEDLFYHIYDFLKRCKQKLVIVDIAGAFSESNVEFLVGMKAEYEEKFKKIGYEFLYDPDWERRNTKRSKLTCGVTIEVIEEL